MTGQCYCGAVQVSASAAPVTTTYCHCNDCRRLSGAPVSAFAAFADGAVSFAPALNNSVRHLEEVRRWFCRACGSPLAAQYDYLPGQTYVPVGLFEDANNLAPAGHSHFGSKLDWLDVSDDLPKDQCSGRARLSEARQ